MIGNWLRAAVTAIVAAERERLFLWLPVVFAGGIVGYFALPVEPEPAHHALIAALAAACLGLRRLGRIGERGWMPLLLLLAAVAGFGFTAAGLRAHLRTAPVLDAAPAGQMPPWRRVEASVVAVSVESGSARLLLEAATLEGVEAARTPDRTHIRLPSPPAGIEPGTRIRLLAQLRPPAPPVLPGAYDPARAAWFERIGAEGQGTEPSVIAPPGPRDGAAAVGQWMEQLRAVVGNEIRSVLPGDDGAVAIAMTIGDQRGIGAQAVAALRDSGLAHLLSISGLHLALLGGTVFFVVRFGLALWPRFALVLPVKKLAALAALWCCLGYLALAGAPIPTQRAMLMFGLAMLAIVFDRQPAGMRLLALAAFVVLALAPESVLSPSFQMSFFAVMALIAAHEQLGGSALLWDGVSPVLRYGIGLGVTSLVAGLATGPFGVYHFNRMADYAVIANLVAVPVTGVVVMPALLAAVMLMPFGLAEWPLRLAGLGIDIVLAIGGEIAGWPGAVTVLATPEPVALALTALGLCWLCIWRSPLRLAGAGMIALGAGLGWSGPAADIVLLPELGAPLLRDSDGRLRTPPGAEERFVTLIVGRRDGAERLDPWPAAGLTAEPASADAVALDDRPATGHAAGGLPAAAPPAHSAARADAPVHRCDPFGCVYTRAGISVAFPARPAALSRDCAAALIILPPDLPAVAARPLLRQCRARPPLLAADDLRRDGGSLLFLRRHGIILETVRQSRGDRLWTRDGALPSLPVASAAGPDASD